MTIGPRWLAILAIAVAFPASAGMGPNGMGPNGMGPNGMGPNGMGPNGMGPNGMGPNGMGPNGLGPNGMGPNGMGPNGLGPNGLDVNGMGPNGMGPNGLGPNGLIYLITPDGTQGTSTFRDWFEANPAERSAWMRYFVRCAYDASTGIAYLDSTGKTWLWTGQYGLAMGSLSSGETITLATGQTVREPMTAEEGQWVSACLLAHVNTKGTHQYLSVRLPGDAAAPCPQAAAALAATPGEVWTMAYSFGQFFGDLFAVDATSQPAPAKYSCFWSTNNPPIRMIEAALGRSCDNGDCTYLDDAGLTQHVLTQFLGFCAAPLYGSDPTPWPHSDTGDRYFVNALQVHGPMFAEFEEPYWAGQGNASVEAVDVSTCSVPVTYPAWCTAAEAPFTIPIDLSQRVTCTEDECLGTGFQTNTGASAKLVGLSPGQAVDVLLRNDQDLSIDTSEAFTAIVRYTKSRTGAAGIWAAQQDGTWLDFTHLSGYWDASPLAGAPGPDVWSATGAFDQFEWMQIWPVYPAVDPLESGGKTALKIRVSGATQGTSCTGAKRFKGDGEPGLCLKATLDKANKRFVCAKKSEVGLPCRGLLIWPQSKDTPGWRCVEGGAAVFACTAADAPDLDAAGFVPGRPWCAPNDATSFIGSCH